MTLTAYHVSGEVERGVAPWPRIRAEARWMAQVIGDVRSVSEYTDDMIASSIELGRILDLIVRGFRGVACDDCNRPIRCVYTLPNHRASGRRVVSLMFPADDVFYLGRACYAKAAHLMLGWPSRV